ncbi:hypothetical protein LR48_Vigan352s001000 [Vigna angularis]|uniref:Secreted protein n=1 Tax=Phaseolus angularis TaxID=3914 RepID=A0A0L9T9I8_PHAAN|nr:hypothetical protein LR48_Vigan352s001000 [Vigna angularis]
MFERSQRRGLCFELITFFLLTALCERLNVCHLCEVIRKASVVRYASHSGFAMRAVCVVREALSLVV